MKPKNHGILSFAAAALLLAGIMAYQRYGLPEPRRFVPPNVHGASQQVRAPGAAEIRRMRKLEKQMQQLAVPIADSARPVTLALFGNGQENEAATFYGPEDAETDRGFAYLLSFTFTGGRSRFCILDGRLYQKGSRLPDGTRVERIEPDRVRVADGNRSSWLQMERPEKPDPAVGFGESRLTKSHSQVIP